MPSFMCSQRAARTMRAVLLFLLLTAAPFPSFAADATTAALTFVKQRHLGNNLGSMAFLVASRTVTFATITKQIGLSDAQSLVREKLGALQPKYQEKWDANLAASYAEFFSSDELLSLADKGPASPAAAKFSALQSSVGRSMQTKSTGILQDFVSETLVDALKVSTRQPGKSRG
jgi:hypothetical protein